MAILAAATLVAATVPLVYRDAIDLLAPALPLQMLLAIALGLLAHSTRKGAGTGPVVFASICLTASLLALLRGAYAHFALGTYRPGLGNNPIHYSSLAAMSGGPALVGVAAGKTSWRCLFLFGPVFGLGCALIADSRGPMLGALTMSAVGLSILSFWLWRDRLFRTAVLFGVSVAAVASIYLVNSGGNRLVCIAGSVSDIFCFTGGPGRY